MNATNKPEKIQIQDFLFFDTIALMYLVQETPLALLAKAITFIDKKIANTIYTILTQKQKEILNIAISLEKTPSGPEKEKIVESLTMIAQSLCEKGLIYKKGIYYYGKEKKIN